MRSAALVAASLAVLQVGQVAAADGNATCPKFSEQKIEDPEHHTDRFAAFNGGTVALVSVLLVDADGAATAYHPKGNGIDSLCNAVAPIVNGQCVAFVKGQTDKLCYDTVEEAQRVNWVRASSPPMCIFGFEAPSKQWGGNYGSGELEVQGDNEPAPGYFRSTTGFSLKPKKGEKTRQYVRADTVPYVAVPAKYTAGEEVALKGGAALVVQVRTGREVLAIVGDTKKKDRLGEVSIAVAQLMEHPNLQDPVPLTPKQLETMHGIEAPYTVTNDGVVRAKINPTAGPYMIFTFGKAAGKVKTLELSAVRKLARDALTKFGGQGSLVACAKQFFEKTK
uniref:hypothetical protein n=1 Tax=Cupriavidus yeoncheonensis TaxID=1462994 RepID=UPI003F49A8F6